MRFARLISASVLSLCIIWAGFTWRPFSVVAADQNAAILQAVQMLQASVNDMRVQVASLSNEVKNDRASMLKRTDAAQAAAGQALDSVAAVDAGHEASTMVQQDTRLTTIEALFKQQRDDAKASNDAVMAWVRPAVTGVFLSIVGLGLGFITHKRNMESKMQKVESDVAKTERNTNSLTAALVKSEKLASHAEGFAEGRESEQRDR